MRRPPSLSTTTVLANRVIVGVAVLAVLVSLTWWSGSDVSFLVIDIRAFCGQPWRLLTTTLLHINFLHLAFNCYWLWVFGSVVESVFGHLETAGLLLFLSVGSSAVMGLFGEDGVGLSGVVYGLFAMLCVLSNRDERFTKSVDTQVVALFVFWFFLCIFTTWAHIFPVANVGHGAGAVLGAAIGFALGPPFRRGVLIGLIAFVAILVMVVGCLCRPYLNMFGAPGQDSALLAYLDLEGGQPESAITLYLQALEKDKNQPDWWYNLGLAYAQLGNGEKSEAALQQAKAVGLDEARLRTGRAYAKSVMAHTSQTRGDHGAAVLQYREALEINDKEAALWYNLGVSYQHLGRLDEALESYQRAASLEPTDQRYREAMNALAARIGKKLK
jgi:membrane associated rhomboid family serine protease/cytochrome c-type biogenesis protein CcmH/NrfG